MELAEFVHTAASSDSGLLFRLNTNSISSLLLSAVSLSFAAVEQTPLSIVIAAGVSIATGYILVSSRQSQTAIRTYFKQRRAEEEFNKGSLTGKIADLEKQIADEAMRSKKQINDESAKSHDNEMRMRKTLHDINNGLYKINLRWDELLLGLGNAKDLPASTSEQIAQLTSELTAFKAQLAQIAGEGSSP